MKDENENPSEIQMCARDVCSGASCVISTLRYKNRWAGPKLAKEECGREWMKCV